VSLCLITVDTVDQGDRRQEKLVAAVFAAYTQGDVKLITGGLLNSTIPFAPLHVSATLTFPYIRNVCFYLSSMPVPDNGTVSLFSLLPLFRYRRRYVAFQAEFRYFVNDASRFACLSTIYPLSSLNWSRGVIAHLVQSSNEKLHPTFLRPMSINMLTVIHHIFLIVIRLITSL